MDGIERILLIDDDRATLLALSEALRSRLPSVGVDTATSAMTAMRLLQQTRYDLVITDVVMPGSDGLALLEQVQDRYPARPGDSRDRKVVP